MMIQTVKPETVGFSGERLQRIERMVQSYVDDGKLAGVMTLVARHGSVAHCFTYGMRDIEARAPLEADTIFAIHSMTKPITAAAVMLLYEEGHFHLWDPIADFIPAFGDVQVYAGRQDGEVALEALARPIMIRDLLMHTAGLAYDFTAAPPMARLYRAANYGEPDITLAERIERLAQIPLSNQPGAQWRYGVANDVLAYLVESLSGMPFDDFLRARLFEPLGMAATDFHVPAEKADRLAKTYSPGDDNELEEFGADRTSRLLRPRSNPDGGGGLVSTAGDYLRFCQMILNGGELDGARILGRKTVELMLTNHLPPEQMPIGFGPSRFKGSGYGLGFSVGVDIVQSQRLGSTGEVGWSGAANTSFWIDPREELIGVLMTQFMPYGYYPVSSDFKVLTYQALVD